MRRVTSRQRFGRAIIGVVALYALLLQAFLVAGTAKVAGSPLGLLCAHESDAPAGGIPAPHDHACCTVAQEAASAVPPEAVTVAASVPPACETLAWRPESWIPRTGPPVRAQGPRGPPLA